MPPYLLRDADFFETFTKEIERNLKRFHRYGINAPAIHVQGVPSGKAANSYFNSLQRLVIRLPDRIREMVRRIIRRNDYNEHTSRASLTALPTEIILQVMGYLPASSLYCLRQTSTRFMLLFATKELKYFHQAYGAFSVYTGFNMDVLSAAEKNAVANSLHHEKYCASCLAAEESGALESRLEMLRRLRHCDGCNRLHASALFLPEAHEEDGAGAGLQCIGRLGHITLCNHRSCRPTTWHDVCQGSTSSWRYPRATRHSLVCTNQSHQPESDSRYIYFFAGSAFPRLIAQDSAVHPSVFQIGYGWDLPLLKIYTPFPTVASIQRALSEVVLNAFNEHKLCPHISADKEIQTFIQRGICKCFSSRSFIFPYSKPNLCKCQRQVTLECRICGAVYTWHMGASHVILSFRYVWHIQRPTSPGWLGLIDQEVKKKLFTKENQNVLWCETPNCRTNTRGRWEALVKENLEREYMNTPDNEAENWSDYLEALFASDQGFFQNW